MTQNVSWIAPDTFDLWKTGIFVAVGYNSVIAFRWSDCNEGREQVFVVFTAFLAAVFTALYSLGVSLIN